MKTFGVLHGARTLYAIARGVLGYWRFPEQRDAWGGAFNGQGNRIAIFDELNAIYRFRRAFESGTYRGTTASFLASAIGGRVWTAEIDPWSFGFCQARFLLDRRIKTIFGDSRQALPRVMPRLRTQEPSFFYLDAHWGEELPLRREIETILAEAARAVVMIDDCQVEGDSGYGYDDYGTARAITLDYIRAASRRFGPRLFFPRLAATHETGERRGCAILLGADVPMPANGFRTLREFPPAAEAPGEGPRAGEQHAEAAQG